MKVKNPLAAAVFGTIIIACLLMMAVPILVVIIRSYL